MAQAVGAMEATTRDPRSQRGMLVGIKHLEIDHLARVGDRIVFQVVLIRRLGPFTLTRVTALCEDTRLAEGELKFFIEGGE